MNEDELLRNAWQELYPRVKASAVSLILGSDHANPKLCLELGAAVLCDKPIVVVYPDGTLIPINLRRVASKVITGDPRDPVTLGRMTQALVTLATEDLRARRRRVM